MTDTTVEPPEHRACRTPTTQERRGVEAVLNRWRLGDSNWRNLYIGGRHVGVTWIPGLSEEVIAAMNGDPDRDERLRTEGRREAAGWIADQIRASYAQCGDRALLEALGYAARYAGTGTERSAAATEPSNGGPVGPKPPESV